MSTRALFILVVVVVAVIAATSPSHAAPMTREGMTSPQHYDADRILNSIDSLITTLLSTSSTRQHQQQQDRQMIETRQHWSHGFAPGGRRSDPALKERQASKMAISSVIRYLLDRAPAPLPSAEDEELLMDELSQLPSAPEPDMATRQHWSNSWQPGGKRSAPSSATSSVGGVASASEGVAVPSKRQHWSYGFGPGGKRSVELMDDGGDDDNDNL